MDSQPTRRTVVKAGFALSGLTSLTNQTRRAKADEGRTKQNLRNIAYGQTKTGQVDGNDPQYPYSNSFHPHAEPITFNSKSGDEVVIRVESSDFNGIFYAIETPHNNLWYKSHSNFSSSSGWVGYHGVLDQDGDYTVWVGPYPDTTSGQYTISLKKVGDGHLLDQNEVIEEELTKSGDIDWNYIAEKGGESTSMPTYEDIFLLSGTANQQTHVTVSSPDFTPKVVYSPRSQQISNHSVRKGNTEGTKSTAKFSHTFSEQNQLWFAVTALENNATGKYTIKTGNKTAQSEQITVVQGNEEHTVTPLSNGETVKEFYGLYEGVSGSSHTSTDIEQSNTSLLFFWDGSTGDDLLGPGEVNVSDSDTLSLVAIHDDPADNTGGSVKFSFSGLPVDEGQWVLMDDPPSITNDFDNATDSTIEWHWQGGFNDGGAFRGGLTDDVNITIDPEFNFDGSEEPINDWQLLTGDAQSPKRISLSPNTPVTLKRSRRKKDSNSEFSFMCSLLIPSLFTTNNKPLDPTNWARVIDNYDANGIFLPKEKPTEVNCGGSSCDNYEIDLPFRLIWKTNASAHYFWNVDIDISINVPSNSDFSSGWAQNNIGNSKRVFNSTDVLGSLSATYNNGRKTTVGQGKELFRPVYVKLKVDFENPSIDGPFTQEVKFATPNKALLEKATELINDADATYDNSITIVDQLTKAPLSEIQKTARLWAYSQTPNAKTIDPTGLPENAVISGIGAFTIPAEKRKSKNRFKEAGAPESKMIPAGPTIIQTS